VVYLDFNEIEIGNSYEKTINNIKNFICDIYNKYKGIKIGSLTEYEKKKMWEKFINFNIKDDDNDDDDLDDSIIFLYKIIYKLLNKQIILLIDSYDSLILDALNTDFF